MRVLDIDLDFFLSGVCELAEVGARPTGCAAWPAEEMRAFLEERCGLSRKRPLPGAVFETHDGALTHWKARMDAGAPYDFATLAVSPRYSPKEADALIGVFSEYLA